MRQPSALPHTDIHVDESTYSKGQTLVKYGRRTPKDAPALMFASFRNAAAVIPNHPASEDYLANLHSWKVLGNDVAGDCNAVTWANLRRLTTATLASEYYPTQEQVWAFYKTQNPSFNPTGSASKNGPGSAADQGMEIQTGLEYLHSNGGPDGVKAVAFAKVDVTNIEEVRAALAIFGGLWLGITVLDANMDQFNSGLPWSDVANATIDGGHAILGGGYTPNVKFITWGQETEFATSFWNGSAGGQKLVEEAWVVIWPEHLGSKEFMAGVDLNALAAAYQELTGKTLNVVPTPSPAPTPVPTPTPTPSPAPGSDAADEALAAVARPWSSQAHWFSNNKQMAKAIKTWLAAKGL